MNAPRQLLLCPRQRLFVSLEVQGGAARVAVWALGSDGDGGFARLAAEVGVEGVAAARCAAWLDAELAWLDPEAASTGGAVALALLMGRELVILAVGPAGATERLRVPLGFKATCLSWAADGTQLLVGGPGQMACVCFDAWRGGPEPPAAGVRHLLCAGACCEVHAVHRGAFVCRLEQAADTQQPEGDLRLPSGQRLPLGLAGPQRRMVVEVENPQDCPQEEEPPPPVAGGLLGGGRSGSAMGGGLLGDLGGGAFGAVSLDVGAEAAASLRVVPLRRCLLPLRYERGAAAAAAAASGSAPAGGQPWRLRCGKDRKVEAST